MEAASVRQTQGAEPDRVGRRMSKSSSHRTLLVLFFSLVLDLLAFTVILPLLPSILDYYSRNDQSGLLTAVIQRAEEFRVLIRGPDSKKFNLVLLGGFLGSLFSFLQFLASPLLGALSDIYGRKSMLIFSMLGVALSYAMWAVSRKFELFVLARIVGGISKGNISISTAVVADVTAVEKRNRGMVVIGIAFSVGFLLGPLIGAVFSIWGKGLAPHDAFTSFQYPALFSLSLALLDVFLIALLFRETLPVDKRAPSLGQGILSTIYLLNPISLFRFDALSKVATKDQRNLRILGLSYFIYLFLFSGLEYSLTFLTHQRFSYTRMEQGKMFLFIGVVMLLVQGLFVRRRPAGSERKTVITGMSLIIPGLLFVGWASNIYMLYSGLVLYSVAAASVVTCMTSMASEFGEGDEKGKVLGIFRSLGALSRALGPVTACVLYWTYGPCVMYMIGAGLILFPLLLIALTRPAEKQD